MLRCKTAVVVCLSAWSLCLTFSEAAERAKPKGAGKGAWPVVVRTFKGAVPLTFATDPEGEHLLAQIFTTEGKQWAVHSVATGEQVQTIDGFTGWTVRRPAVNPQRYGGGNQVVFLPLKGCSLKKMGDTWTAYESRPAGVFFWDLTKKAWERDPAFKLPVVKEKETSVGKITYIHGNACAVCVEQKLSGNDREQLERRLVVFDPKTGDRLFETFWNYVWNNVWISSDGKYLAAICSDTFHDDPKGPDSEPRGDIGFGGGKAVRGWHLGADQAGFHTWATSGKKEAELVHLKQWPHRGGGGRRSATTEGYRQLPFPQIFCLPAQNQFILNLRHLPKSSRIEGTFELYDASPWKKARDLTHMHTCRLFGAIGEGPILVGASTFRFVFWDVDTGKSKAIFSDSLQTDSFEAMTRGNRLFTSHENGQVQVWESRDKK